MKFKKGTKQGKCNHAIVERDGGNVVRDGGNVERNNAIVEHDGGNVERNNAIVEHDGGIVACKTRVYSYLDDSIKSK